MTAPRLVSAAALLCTISLPASAACDGALVRLTGDGGRSFVADRYGSSNYQTRTDRGRLTYTVHVWRGRVGKNTHFLHFTEIPGTSGPNFGSEGKLSAYPTRIAWKPASTFVLPAKLVIYSGPLNGEWTTTCDSAAR